MEALGDKLKKLKALAGNTEFAGEREAALNRLKCLMEKNGISEADIEDEAIETRAFKYKGEKERRLLTQVAYKVLGTAKFVQYDFKRAKKKIANSVGIDCTNAQKVEIEFLFDFYKVLYAREERALYSAFVQKHNIYGKVKDGTKETMSNEALQKMRNFMNGMDDETPFRRLDGGNQC